ncbi:oxidoreductase [Synechococcus sp. CCY 0621]|uniref:oxidoreductase n=1 Tax=Synechococcus sp. CCY 0621 TaxID=2815603 RepID=UPI001C235FB7|nr:oxidoreductase [Synechococcus sp. CCY 0621]
MADIPDQTGRLALVTGASSGLGLETARALSARGATVVLACQTMELAEQTCRALRETSPGALEPLELDLADLGCVHRAAQTVASRWPDLDLLINNAGVMGLPRAITRDGFERHFGINYLGHFALTRALLPLLESRPSARVVTVTSTWHYLGRINFDDLQGERRYDRWRAYAQSKLANSMFSLELHHRLAAAGSRVISVAAHPGVARTGIQSASVAASGDHVEALMVRLMSPLFQDAATGASCQLFAATTSGVQGGQVYAPNGVGQQRGSPTLRRFPRAALDRGQRQRLWSLSEQMCERTT